MVMFLNVLHVHFTSQSPVLLTTPTLKPIFFKKNK